MADQLRDRVADLGLELPTLTAPVGSFVGVNLIGDLAYVSGQLPVAAGVVRYTGRVGEDVDLTDAQVAAQLCALNILAQLARAYPFAQVLRCVRLGGFVNAAPDFQDHPAVLNGASDLMIQVLGDAGRHARAAVGVASLPLGAAVEVDGIFHLSTRPDARAG